jgi:hypothetical protein
MASVGRFGLDEHAFAVSDDWGMSAESSATRTPRQAIHMTRRPPRRAPCLARHYQVTMRALFNVLAQVNLDRNFPSGMGDRRVGT